MTAYDYQRQEWVEGEDARYCLRAQLQEELELLEGPRGADYLRFVQCDTGNTLETTIRNVRARLASL